MSVTHEITLLISVWCLVSYAVHSIPSRAPNDPQINLALPSSWSRQNSSNTSSAVNSFTKLCRPIKFPILKPKRTRVSFRKNAGFLDGCLNEQVMKSPMVDDLVMVIHLSQKNYNNYDMNIKVRIIPPLEGFAGRLTIVLYSSNASKWLLDLYDLLAVNSRGQHRVVLTNRKSTFYSEQMHAERHLTVQYLDDVPEDKNLNEWENLYQLLMNRSFGPIAFLVSRSSMHTGMENYAVNMISVQLSDLPKLDKSISSRESQCVVATSDRLKKFVDVWLESEGDIGFASCRSHKWEDEDKATPKRLLEIVEIMTNRKEDGNRFEMRLVVPSKDTPGSASKMVLAVFATQSNPILLDIQSVLREVVVLSNQKIAVYPDDVRATRVRIRHLPGVNDVVAFHASLSAILGHLSGWSVERLTLRPLMDAIPHPVYLSIRLHDAPLILHDLDPWLVVACFDTRDVEVKVPRRPFTSLGLNKSQVLLGGNPKCKLYEDRDKWLWKVLLRSKDPCTILDQDLGNQYQIQSQLSLVTSEKLLPYRLNFLCTARREAGVDLPPPNQQNNPNFLWKTYNKQNRTYEIRTSDNVISSIGHSFKLELFRDKEMKKKIDSDSAPVKKNLRLYGRVEPSSQGVKGGLMIRDCVLAGPSPQYSAKQYILHHGCEMGAYFRWEEADSFRVKTFSFEMPRPSFFGPDGFYLHCFIQPCNYLEKEEDLPRCWNQRYICYFPQTPGPLQLRAGPFPYTPLPKPRRSGLEIPIWGALLIAAIALILGMGVSGLLWVIHHLTRRRRNSRAVRRPVHHSPVCEPSCVLLPMNPSRLEQERRHLLHNGSFPLTIGTPNGI